MTAQPTEDPSDPLVILREQLRRMLHVWSLAVVASSHPGYYEELAALRDGTAPTVPVTEAIPDWAGRVAAARHTRR